MPKIILIIGPCGAGKTTYARQYYADHLHVDYEQIIQTLFATPERFRFYPHVRKVGKLMYETAIEAFAQQRKSICIPNCGTTRDKRAYFVRLAHQYDMPIHCTRLLVDHETSTARAKADTLRPKSSRACWSAINDHWFRDWQTVDCDKEGFTSYQEVVW